MEFIEAEVSTAIKGTSTVYDAIKKAILQLNIWLTSVENTIKECVTKPCVKKADNFKAIHKKMKSHQDCVMRIIKICQNLSMRTELREMDEINEYILLVMDRFVKLREILEISLKMNDIEMIKSKCKELKEKMNIQNDMLLSFYGQGNENLNNKNQSIKISTQLEKIKFIFTRYTEELEIIQKKLVKVNEKEFDKYNVEMEMLFKSVKMIEESMEQQWRNASDIFKIHSVQEPLPITDLLEMMEAFSDIKEYIPLINNNLAPIILDAITNYSTLENKSQTMIFCTESTFSNVNTYDFIQKINKISIKWTMDNTEIGLGSRAFTIESLKVYTHYCNIHYLLREIPIYKLATFQSLQSSHTSPYVHFSFPKAINIIPQKLFLIFQEPYRGKIVDLQMDSLCSVPYTPYSTTVYKCAPHIDFLCFLNRSLTIIAKKGTNVDEELYKDMIVFERSHKTEFERDYEKFSEECLSQSNSLFLKENDQNLSKHCNRFQIIKKCKRKILYSVNSICKLAFSSEGHHDISSSRKYPNARAKLARPIINFIRNYFQFDIGLGTILLIKNAFYQLIHIFQFDQWVRTMGEVNQYRLISATV